MAKLLHFCGPGGRGKSTLSANIATASALNGNKTLYIDFDSQPTGQIIFSNYFSNGCKNGFSVGDLVDVIQTVEDIKPVKIDENTVDETELDEYISNLEEDLQSQIEKEGLTPEDNKISVEKSAELRESICRHYMDKLKRSTQSLNLDLILNDRGSDKISNIHEGTEEKIADYITSLNYDVIVIDAKAGNDYHVSQWWNRADINVMIGEPGKDYKERIQSAIIALQKRKLRDAIADFSNSNKEYSKVLSEISRDIDVKNARMIYTEAFKKNLDSLENAVKGQMGNAKGWKAKIKEKSSIEILGMINDYKERSDKDDVMKLIEDFSHFYSHNDKLKKFSTSDSKIFNFLRGLYNSTKVCILMNRIGEEAIDIKEMNSDLEEGMKISDEIIRNSRNFLCIDAFYPYETFENIKKPLFPLYEPGIVKNSLNAGIPFVAKYENSDVSNTIKKISKYLVEYGGRK